MREAKREVVVAVVVLAVSAFFFMYLWLSSEQRLGASSPTTLPLVVTSAMTLLSALLLVRNVGRWRAARLEARRATTEEPPARDATAPEERAQRRHATLRGLTLVAWTILYLAALPLLGYLLTTALYIGGLAYLFGNRNVVAIAALMIVTPIALLLFFERYMVILLPSGSLFS